MNQISIAILGMFALWVAWRLVTRTMRRTIVAREMKTTFRNGEAREVTFEPVSLYDIFCRVAHLLWHNARKRPRLMSAAILNVLRRPRG